jgi:hypothetical protein
MRTGESKICVVHTNTSPLSHRALSKEKSEEVLLTPTDELIVFLMKSRKGRRCFAKKVRVLEKKKAAEFSCVA